MSCRYITFIIGVYYGNHRKNNEDGVTYKKETVNDCDLKVNDTNKLYNYDVVNFELKHVKDLRQSDRCFPNDPSSFFFTVRHVMGIVNVNAEAMNVFA